MPRIATLLATILTLILLSTTGTGCGGLAQLDLRAPEQRPFHGVVRYYPGTYSFEDLPAGYFLDDYNGESYYLKPDRFLVEDSLAEAVGRRVMIRGFFDVMNYGEQRPKTWEVLVVRSIELLPD